MSLKDDILNTIDDPKAFTNQVSKLVHMPTSVVKSLTEPLGLKDYMNLAKAVDEEDPESAKEILQSGFDQLDDVAKTLLDEYTSKASTSSKNVASAGNTDGNTTVKSTTTQPTQPTQPMLPTFPRVLHSYIVAFLHSYIATFPTFLHPSISPSL